MRLEAVVSDTSTASIVGELQNLQELMAWGFGLAVFALGVILVGGWRA